MIYTYTLAFLLLLSLQYPSICWYQSGTYNIQIFNAIGNVEISVGPRQYRSTDTPHITEIFQSGLYRDQMYKVVVTAESFGESFQAEKIFSEYIYMSVSSHSSNNNSRYKFSIFTFCVKYEL